MRRVVEIADEVRPFIVTHERDRARAFADGETLDGFDDYLCRARRGDLVYEASCKRAAWLLETFRRAFGGTPTGDADENRCAGSTHGFVLISAGQL
jgi:hypothetical protein